MPLARSATRSRFQFVRGERKIRAERGTAARDAPRRENGYPTPISAAPIVRGARTALSACVLVLAGAGPERVNYITISAPPPRDVIAQRMSDDNYAGAMEIIDRELARSPRDPWLLYNATCALAQLGETDRAGAMLLEAMRAGYRRFSWIQRDPDLKPIRATPRYRALLDARGAADSMLASRRLESWLERLNDGRFRHETDDRHAIDYLTCLHEDQHAAAEAMAAAQIDRLSGMFGSWPAQRVLIVLAEPGDGLALLERTHVGGVYRHDSRELIVLDSTMTLRHELAHVMHNFHMDALNQQHPVWIQEGLATLFECDIEASDFANPRQNQAKALLREHDLMPWKELLALSEQAFNAQAHRLYPQVMSMFRFIAVQRDVAAWYSAYTSGFDSESTGAAALEAMFELPLHEIEATWRQWLAAQPVVAGPSARSARGDVSISARPRPINHARPALDRPAPLVRFKPAAGRSGSDGPTESGG